MIEIHKSIKLKEGDYILIQNYRYGKEIPIFEVLRLVRMTTIKKTRVRQKKHNEMKAATFFTHAKRGFNLVCSRIASSNIREFGSIVELTFSFPKRFMVRRGRFSSYTFAGFKRANPNRLAHFQRFFLISEDEARLYLL